MERYSFGRRGVGGERREEWAIAVWLDILNEKGEHISESEKIHMAPEEYVNAKYFLKKSYRYLLSFPIIYGGRCCKIAVCLSFSIL